MIDAAAVRAQIAPEIRAGTRFRAAFGPPVPLVGAASASSLAGGSGRRPAVPWIFRSSASHLVAVHIVPVGGRFRRFGAVGQIRGLRVLAGFARRVATGIRRPGHRRHGPRCRSQGQRRPASPASRGLRRGGAVPFRAGRAHRAERRPQRLRGHVVQQAPTLGQPVVAAPPQMKLHPILRIPIIGRPIRIGHQRDLPRHLLQRLRIQHPRLPHQKLLRRVPQLPVDPARETADRGTDQGRRRTGTPPSATAAATSGNRGGTAAPVNPTDGQIPAASRTRRDGLVPPDREHLTDQRRRRRRPRRRRQPPLLDLPDDRHRHPRQAAALPLHPAQQIQQLTRARHRQIHTPTARPERRSRQQARPTPDPPTNSHRKQQRPRQVPDLPRHPTPAP